MKRNPKAIPGSACAMLLDGIFAFCIISVLLYGAGIYKKLSADDTALWERRTASQFITTKLRQAAGHDWVETAGFGDGDALVLRDPADPGYSTAVYCFDGMLRELYAAEGVCDPADGEPIAAAKDLKISIDNGLVTADFCDSEGLAVTVKVFLRDGE